MKMWHKIITTLLFVFTGLVLFCQNLNTSPYTRFGLGEINKPITTHYQGMGGLSVSYSDFQMVNISNTNVKTGAEPMGVRGVRRTRPP